MPFPVQVDAAQIGVTASPGPIQTTAAVRYVFLLGADNNIHAWKSSDSGVTWALTDDANAQPSSASHPHQAVLKSSGIVFVVITDSSDTFLQVLRFNTATDTWLAAVVTVIDGFTSGNSLCCLIRSFDDNIVIVATPASFVVGADTRTAFTVFDTVALTVAAWTACGFIGAGAVSYTPRGIMQGSGRVHFWYHDNAPGGASAFQQAIRDNNTLGAIQVVAAYGAATSVSGFYGVANLTNLRFCLVNSANGDTLIVYGATIAAVDAPVWSTQLIQVVAGNAINTAALAADNTQFVLMLSSVDIATGTVYVDDIYIDVGAGLVFDSSLGNQSMGIAWAIVLLSGDWAFGFDDIGFWYWEESAAPLVVSALRQIINSAQLISFMWPGALYFSGEDAKMYAVTKTRVYERK